MKDHFGGSVLEFRIDEADREAALEALRAIGDGEVTYDEARREVSLPAPDGTRTMMEAVRRLDAAGVVPTDAAVTHPDPRRRLPGTDRSRRDGRPVRRRPGQWPWTPRSSVAGTNGKERAMSSTTTTASGAARNRALTDVAMITRRNVRRNVRLPQLLIFSTIQPVMFLLLFTYVFGGAIGRAIPPAAGGRYINWLMPGLLVQIATFGAGQTAMGLTEDLSNGVIDRFRSLPMARSAVLAGRTLSDVVRNAFVLTLMLVVGFAVGFRYQTSFLGLVAAVGLALTFAYSLSWVMATIGLKVKNPEAAQSAVFLPVFPLVFASSVFVPTETMPSWLRAFADNQPVTIVANALRGLTMGPGALLEPGQTVAGQVLLALAWIAGITLVFAPLAVRVYRRTVA
ncbi:MAG: ABC transporter permease [Nitriliruptorales bacterium]